MVSDSVTNILATVGAGAAGAAAAVGLGLLVVVPAMRNTCMLFNKRCAVIQYRRRDNGELLVTDDATGLSYWFDGNFIRSYGPALPGSCPDSLAVDATGVYTAIGPERRLCERFEPDGVTCASMGALAPPTALTGTPAAGSAGAGRLMEPAFVLNAHTLQASEQQVLCSRARGAVESSFVDAALGEVKVRIPRGDAQLDVTQIFEVLRRNNAYTLATNPEPAACAGHGALDPLTALCVCDTGYTGFRCATALCADDADCGHGTCNAGLCDCAEGWTGDACDQRACAAACVNGACDGGTGLCVCTPGFTGDACADYVCTPTCDPLHGACNPANGVCECEDGWTGVTCGNVACPSNCSGHGVCNAPGGVCECVAGWVGLACDSPACVNDCSQRGVCDMATNTCACDEGWRGDDCATPLCPSGCCAHGRCVDTSCECDAGWSGPDCGTPDDPNTSAALCPVVVRCLNNCSQRGVCYMSTNTCACDEGWSGEDCGVAVPLPWEVVDTGVSRKYMEREHDRALEGKITRDCSSGACVDCGLGCKPGRELGCGSVR